MNVHRRALALAAVLAATVVTGGAAIMGISRPATPPASTATPAVLVQQAPASHDFEEGD